MTQNADVAFHTKIKFVTADPVLIKAGRVATSVLPESHQFVKSVESTIFTSFNKFSEKSNISQQNQDNESFYLYR
jgi:hypothetical protein